MRLMVRMLSGGGWRGVGMWAATWLRGLVMEHNILSKRWKSGLSVNISTVTLLVSIRVTDTMLTPSTFMLLSHTITISCEKQSLEPNGWRYFNFLNTASIVATSDGAGVGFLLQDASQKIRLIC